MKFRKKPIIVDAEQYCPGLNDSLDDYYLRIQLGIYLSGGVAWIDTLEGRYKVSPNDWIITGVKGERYPCKPDIFEMTYEAVDDETNGV